MNGFLLCRAGFVRVGSFSVLPPQLFLQGAQGILRFDSAKKKVQIRSKEREDGENHKEPHEDLAICLGDLATRHGLDPPDPESLARIHLQVESAWASPFNGLLEIWTSGKSKFAGQWTPALGL